jgi:hypothetical protein
MILTQLKCCHRYVLLYLIVFIYLLATIGLMLLLNKKKQKEMAETKKRLAPKRQKTTDPNTFTGSYY